MRPGATPDRTSGDGTIADGRTADGTATDGTTTEGRTADPPELPALDAGIQLLESEERPTGPLCSLVVDHVLREGGPARWVDANGHARTRPLARVAPDGRVLDRIRVARGFTAFQHYALVEALAARIREGAGSTDGGDVSLVVVPAIDAPYRDDDLRGDEGREMLVRAIAVLAGIARRHDCPVLATRVAEDGLSAPVENAAGRPIRYETTDLGPRFVGEDFETLVYPTGDGLVQTTLAFWERVLRARAADREPAGLPDRSSPGVVAGGTH